MPEPTEPLAIEFANTWYASRGKEREGVGTPAELSTWLREHGLLDDAKIADTADTADAADTAPAVDEPAVQSFLALRDSIRSLVRAATMGDPLPTADMAALNEASQLAPRWPVLAGTAESGYSVTEVTAADPLPSARAQIARDAITLLGGPLREDVRACQAPGCVQYFIKNHPRREWCSAACGNRARVARHYTKSKAS